MPDTTKSSWACDWCGKERFKGDNGFYARYTVNIESAGGYAFILGSRKKEDRYVCYDCIQKVEQIMIGSQN